MKGNTMNISLYERYQKEKYPWMFSFHEDKNISFCVAGLLIGYYDFKREINYESSIIQANRSVHNLTNKQVKTAIKTALNYIKNNKKG